MSRPGNRSLTQLRRACRLRSSVEPRDRGSPGASTACKCSARSVARALPKEVHRALADRMADPMAQVSKQASNERMPWLSQAGSAGNGLPGYGRLGRRSRAACKANGKLCIGEESRDVDAALAQEIAVPTELGSDHGLASLAHGRNVLPAAVGEAQSAFSPKLVCEMATGIASLAETATGLGVGSVSSSSSVFSGSLLASAAGSKPISGADDLADAPHRRVRAAAEVG
eukprot:CAMPEP_0170570766 /NCGR_PEP_ID=MMETSP0224-20130122/1291_1 /TAXON_ID=285029 /ORGANISM="Togula jolla, Strain CCCM 725" /LENGTH=227 /DNA_ID=CAMNT_0010893077 /DNA_START=437 /DNA_END=1120 /DNA_ORIENTATION=+